MSTCLNAPSITNHVSETTRFKIHVLDHVSCTFLDSDSKRLLMLTNEVDARCFVQVRLAFGLYVGKRLEGKMISTRWITPTAGLVKNENTDRQEMVALLETRNAFAG